MSAEESAAFQRMMQFMDQHGPLYELGECTINVRGYEPVTVSFKSFTDEDRVERIELRKQSAAQENLGVADSSGI